MGVTGLLAFRPYQQSNQCSMCTVSKVIHAYMIRLDDFLFLTMKSYAVAVTSMFEGGEY